jgi:hypothetical protein
VTGQDLLDNLLFREAADRIKQLEREQTRLRTQCDGLMQAGMNNGQSLILAEAKLAKAMESLREMVESSATFRERAFAYAVLAELEKPNE